MAAVNGLELRIGFNGIRNFLGHDGKEFHGMFGPFMEVIHDWTKAPGLNRTLTSSMQGFGFYNHTTGNYTGILGMLQRNESDMAFDPNVDFNLVQGNGVARGQLMECVPPAIISAYSSKTRATPVDILIDTSKDIGYGNLSIFMAAFVVLTYLFSMNQKFHHKYQAVVSVTFYILQKIPIKTFNLRTVLISITLTVTLLYLTLSFSSLLHVTLVKVDPPIVVTNYDQIIDKLDEALKTGGKFRVAWSYEYPDTELFRRGESGSKEAVIWEKNVKNGGPDFVKLGRDMKRANALIRDQNMVVILNKGYAHFVRHSLCSFNQFNVHFHSLITVDKDGNWNQKGYVIRESLSGPLRSFVDDRTLRIHESGLNHYVYRILVDLKFPLLYYNRKNCSSDEIMIENHHDSGDTTLRNQQFEVTYEICLVMIVLSIIAFLVEHYAKKRRGNKIKVIVTDQLNVVITEEKSDELVEISG